MSIPSIATPGTDCTLVKALLWNARELAARDEAYGAAVMLRSAVTVWTRSTASKHSWWRGREPMSIDAPLAFLQLHYVVTPLQKRRLLSIYGYATHVLEQRAGNCEHLGKLAAEVATIAGEQL